MQIGRTMDCPPVCFYQGWYKMAGNTRGKLKEHFEGIHRNLDWIIYHCQQCITLIADKNPKLKEAIEVLAKGVKVIDKTVQDLYSRL